jgi:hypothetical protein
VAALALGIYLPVLCTVLAGAGAEEVHVNTSDLFNLVNYMQRLVKSSAISKSWF